FVRGHGVGFDPAVAHMRQSRDGLIECEIDVSGHKVAHDLGGARTIRHELESGLGDVLKVNPADVLAGTGSGRAFGRLVGIGLKPCDQALEIAGRQILSCHDHVGITWQPRDRFEIRTDVVGQRINRAIDDVRGPVADAHGIAIGSGAYGASNPIVPDAPVTFSTMTGWPNDVRIGSLRIRARVSTGPPAPYGTKKMTGPDA